MIGKKYIDPVLYGRKFRELLLANGLKESDLARMLGVTRSAVSSWAMGKHILSERFFGKMVELGLRRWDNKPLQIQDYWKLLGINGND